MDDDDYLSPRGNSQSDLEEFLLSTTGIRVCQYDCAATITMTA
jgi:hypothetical protein